MTPCRTFCSPELGSLAGVGCALPVAALALAGAGPARRRDLAVGPGETGGVVQLAGGVLKTQTEQLAPSGIDVLDQLGLGHVAQVSSSHRQASSRMTNLVRTGSLWPASRIASRARSSGTPASSNITRPGLTTATQPSGDPLPDPMRVSAGFLVNGLSG